jgi:hypothetical protein
MHNTDVVFGVGVFEDATCFEQVLFLYLFERHVNQIIFLFAHLKLTYLGILCVSASLTKITMFSHI